MSQTEELQERIHETRDQLQSTVEELQQRFSPAEMTRQSVDYLKREGGGAARKAVDTVQSHPVAFGLMGAGLAWLLFAPSNSHRSAKQSADTVNTEDDEIGGFGDDPYADAEQRRTRSGAPLRRHDGSAQQSSLQRGVRNAGRMIRETSSSVGECVSHTVQTRPLASAAAGVAAGALVAALLPPTEFENRLLGETREQIRRRAADGLSAAGERTATAAEKLAETARHELSARPT